MNANFEPAEDNEKCLEKYGSDLTELARTGKLDPVIGRDTEIRDVIRILSRKTKNRRSRREAGGGEAEGVWGRPSAAKIFFKKVCHWLSLGAYIHLVKLVARTEASSSALRFRVSMGCFLLRL